MIENLIEKIRLLQIETQNYVTNNQLINQQIDFLKFNENKLSNYSKRLEEKTKKMIDEIEKYKKELENDQSLIIEKTKSIM
jgi:hypothetical protein